MDGLHLPTGRVSIEAVVRFLIQELDGEPRREDWEEVLDDAERPFIEHRTCSGLPPSL